MSPARATLLVLALSAGCGDRERAREGVSPAGALAAGVVATVDGAAITLAELQRHVAASGLAPAAALAQLEGELLLAGEARRRGYEASPAVSEIARQAQVQALLIRDVEPVTIGRPELAAAYAASGERFDSPERRASVHLLAALPAQASAHADAAAERYVRDAIAALEVSADRLATLAELRQSAPASLAVKLEQLPAAPRVGRFVDEYGAGLFELAAPGVVPHPVRSPFGWHAIVVTEIIPARRVERADAERELVPELEVAARKLALERLVRKLEGAAPVRHDPRAPGALAALEL